VAAFQLDVLTGAALAEDPPGSLEVCSQQPDALFAQVDITQLDSAINADPDAPTLVEYFTSLTAVDNEDPIQAPDNFEVNGASTTVFARVVQVENLCVSEVVPIELIINPLPQVDISAYDGQVICIDAASGEVIDNDFSPPIIDTGLSSAEFDISWQRNGEVLPADTSAITVDQPGDYQVVATNIDTGCQFSSQASIEESSVPDFEVQVISPPFSRDPIVEVRNISGGGSFEFRLDDGNWVSLGDSESLRFSGFQFGQHQISGRGLLGCGERVKDFQVIGYRSFFTPNQDGFNDRWNIPSLKNQRDALVLIYDRYGKLLYKFRPGGTGWDGTYNGKPMPSNDYWFSVQYTDPRTGKQSIFRGNITLKR
jgi:gliding motility-associated-like protein